MNKLSLLIFIFSISIYYSQNHSVSSIPENLKKNANIVVRNEECLLTINSIDDMQIEYKTALTILNKSGDHHSLISIPYNKSRKVSDIRVEILDENGKTLDKFSKSDFRDVSNNSSGALYIDDRVLYMQYMSNIYPYTIKYSYTIDSSNTIFIPDFFPFYEYNMSLEKSKYVVNNKSGINFRNKISESEIAKVIKSENTNLNFIEFSFENIEAIPEERYAPNLNVVMPKVEFSLDNFTLEGKKGELSSWNNFGIWYYNNLLNPVSIITPEIKAEVLALNLTGTTSEKVKKLYQYMQNKTRYVNVAIGIGGWQPIAADEVRKKGYGDCKGLTNYMRTLLMAAGIKSYYAIIESSDTPVLFDPNFPKMDGNHVILMVPTETENIWLENTSQQVAFNHLSYRTTNRNVLAVKENGIELIKTPIYSAEESKEVLKAKIFLKEDNSISVQSNFEFYGGQYDFNMHLFDLNAVDLKEYIKERHNILKIENLQVENLNNNRDNAAITYKLNFEAKDYAKKLGNDMFFRVMPFYENNYSAVSVEGRKLPVEIPFSYEDDYEIEFLLPLQYKPAEIPLPVNLSTEFGSYSLEIKPENQSIKVIRKININKNIYPKEKFKNYLEFRKKITSYDNTKILLTKI